MSPGCLIPAIFHCRQEETQKSLRPFWPVGLNETTSGAMHGHGTLPRPLTRIAMTRIVGVANMFDILPGSACTAVVELSPILEGARDAARTAFRALPSSPERESILNALGHIGKPTLKRKIRSRVKLITDAIGARFADLELVTDQAVDCRNFYVHGTPGKFSYGVHSDQSTFFTDTLEFVFAASDLIEAGWDIAEWIKEGTTMSHPFGRYHVGYAERLGALKKLVT